MFYGILRRLILENLAGMSAEIHAAGGAASVSTRLLGLRHDAIPVSTFL